MYLSMVAISRRTCLINIEFYIVYINFMLIQSDRLCVVPIDKNNLIPKTENNYHRGRVHE